MLVFKLQVVVLRAECSIICLGPQGSVLVVFLFVIVRPSTNKKSLLIAMQIIHNSSSAPSNSNHKELAVNRCTVTTEIPVRGPAHVNAGITHHCSPLSQNVVIHHKSPEKTCFYFSSWRSVLKVMQPCSYQETSPQLSHSFTGQM